MTDVGIDSQPPRKPPRWLRALGGDDLPSTVELGGTVYRHARTFKHDFFAATGLYEAPADRIVLKIYRRASLLGFPMRWSGRVQAAHESRMYGVFAGLAGIPRFCGRVGPTGFAHAYIPGRPLSKKAAPDDQFFGRLAELLAAVHARGAAYVDLEKCENVLLGDDGRPYLIDFQISFHAEHRWWGRTWLARRVLRMLQRSDRYHLLKHKRRLRPEQLSAEERALAEAVPWWIRLHRLVFRPFTVARRWVLVKLGARRPGRKTHESGSVGSFD